MLQVQRHAWGRAKRAFAAAASRKNKVGSRPLMCFATTA
jgi:hypothetical protein